MSELWRTGRKVGRTIYQMTGPEPSDDDPLIGVMDTPALAEDAVRSHNRAALPGDNSVQCNRCRRWWPEDPEHPGYAGLHLCSRLSTRAGYRDYYE